MPFLGYSLLAVSDVPPLLDEELLELEDLDLLRRVLRVLRLTRDSESRLRSLRRVCTISLSVILSFSGG